MTLVSESIAPYREQNALYQDVWDWDVIVYPDWSIRVLCMTNGCLYEYGHMGRDCDCGEKPRMSSPIVDEYKHPLKEDLRTPRLGAARCLLGIVEGDSIPVMSGKAYRLNGPRTPHEGFRGASIWEMYKQEVRREVEEEIRAGGFFQRLWGWMQE